MHYDQAQQPTNSREGLRSTFLKKAQLSTLFTTLAEMDPDCSVNILQEVRERMAEFSRQLFETLSPEELEGRLAMYRYTEQIDAQTMRLIRECRFGRTTLTDPLAYAESTKHPGEDVTESTRLIEGATDEVRP
jgi:hypothetical protein